MLKGIKQFAIASGIGLVMLNGVGCSNPSTDVGFVGYCTQGAMLGSKRFYGLQTGPTSTGLGWMLSCKDISITPYNMDEEFTNSQAVISADQLKIGFSAHLIFAVPMDRVRDLMEKYNNGATNNDYVIPSYQANLQQKFRAFAREEVKKYNGLQIDIDEASKQITTLTQDYVAAEKLPFKVMSAVVGNIQYPTVVADAVSAKLASTQKLQQQSTELQITAMEAKKKVVEAQGLADAMKIINNQLTPVYLQHEAIEAQKAMINSPNHTTIYIPVGRMGVPLTGTIDTDK